MTDRTTVRDRVEVSGGGAEIVPGKPSKTRRQG